MRLKDKILKMERRVGIYNCIFKHPGIHLSELCRRLKIPKTTMFYHLNYLKKNGLIVVNIEENYSRCYVPNKIGRKEKKILNLIRKEIPQNIILIFGVRQCVSRMEISRELDIPPNTIDYYLKKLLKLEIIEPVDYTDGGIIFNWDRPIIMKRKPVCNEVIYRMKTPFFTYKVLVDYKQCFSKKNIPLLRQLEKEGIWELPDEIPYYRNVIDKIFDRYFEFFPLPFCA